METLSKVLLIVTLLVAVLFTALVIANSKSDPMSGGGGGVRTTFKGKAGFDDFIFRWTLGLASAFMVLTLTLDILLHNTAH